MDGFGVEDFVYKVGIIVSVFIGVGFLLIFLVILFIIWLKRQERKTRNARLLRHNIPQEKESQQTSFENHDVEIKNDLVYSVDNHTKVNNTAIESKVNHKGKDQQIDNKKSDQTAESSDLYAVADNITREKDKENSECNYYNVNSGSSYECVNIQDGIESLNLGEKNDGYNDVVDYTPIDYQRLNGNGGENERGNELQTDFKEKLSPVKTSSPFYMSMKKDEINNVKYAALQENQQKLTEDFPGYEISMNLEKNNAEMNEIEKAHYAPVNAEEVNRDKYTYLDITNTHDKRNNAEYIEADIRSADNDKNTYEVYISMEEQGDSYIHMS
ncbi:uncharacterized protein LOC130636221 [Hydractinia symbiolongicarpus]|uniref:uncharacterized protein LOC130636221 n=1 Tax=Hydractinia symbiolongicarpus TaxID=13093 RepID=UPI00254B0D26|nr:uncharacterized protein LOC130636221 [Hydractinia symbiolongicarpus]XP_057301860.1 uncharacterized protein LOC130636221 [Hydractinia symbiolongicarpus]